MTTYENPAWIFYQNDAEKLDPDKSGKWLVFFNDFAGISKLCRAAVRTGVVAIAKHSNALEGMTCFYLNFDDEVGHRKTIDFLIAKKLIRKTKKGTYSNLSFKLDSQTESLELGSKFKPILQLSDFIDLTTGAWIRQ